MKISGIYKIQSKINPNKIYIGSAIDINKRWNYHREDLRKNKHPNKRFQNHYNKYGESDLLFFMIVGCDKENLISYEQFYIDSLNPYFNICKTAGNWLGHRHSKETIDKIRKNRIGKGYHTDEWKRKASERMSGINHHQFGKRHSPERLLRDSKSQQGKKATYETKHKMSESGKRAWILRKQLNN